MFSKFSAGVCAIAAVLACTLTTPASAAGNDAVVSEIKANCTASQLKRGKSPADAEKACQCSIDEFKKTLSDDQFRLILAGMKNDKAAATELLTKNGPQWAASTMQTLQTAGTAADTKCGTE